MGIRVKPSGDRSTFSQQNPGQGMTRYVLYDTKSHIELCYGYNAEVLERIAELLQRDREQFNGR
jgi:hypothetical protein